MFLRHEQFHYAISEVSPQLVAHNVENFKCPLI